MMEHAGLPVAGYRPQSSERIDLVNENKRLEEEILRVLDRLGASKQCDGRWLAIGRTAIENGFMAVNRAVFQPSRAVLASDDPAPPAAA
jgi:hypothetical protein